MTLSKSSYKNYMYGMLSLSFLFILILSSCNGGGAKSTDKDDNGSKRRKDSCIVPQMIRVDGGKFTMGSNSADDEDQEGPAHEVNLKSFSLSRYEVTMAEFRLFMKTHTYMTDAEKSGFSFTFDGKSLIYEKKGVTWECDVIGNKRVNQEDHPVIHVSRNDAEAYCKWLSECTGKNYRLPTEAEWEYAAKGGPHHDTFEYSGGNDMDKVGWYAWNSDFVTHPVGKKQPNSLGLYDMSGNVWEWCSDWFGPYSKEEQTDPKGPDTGIDGVLRGGAWRFFVERTRCTSRRHAYPAFNGSGPGFRIASSD